MAAWDRELLVPVTFTLYDPAGVLVVAIVRVEPPSPLEVRVTLVGSRVVDGPVGEA